MQDIHVNKYLKYKNKYLKLKNKQLGGEYLYEHINLNLQLPETPELIHKQINLLKIYKLLYEFTKQIFLYKKYIIRTILSDEELLIYEIIIKLHDVYYTTINIIINLDKIKELIELILIIEDKKKNKHDFIKEQLRPFLLQVDEGKQQKFDSILYDIINNILINKVTVKKITNIISKIKEYNIENIVDILITDETRLTSELSINIKHIYNILEQYKIYLETTKIDIYDMSIIDKFKFTDKEKNNITLYLQEINKHIFDEKIIFSERYLSDMANIYRSITYFINPENKKEFPPNCEINYCYSHDKNGEILIGLLAKQNKDNKNEQEHVFIHNNIIRQIFLPAKKLSIALHSYASNIYDTDVSKVTYIYCKPLPAMIYLFNEFDKKTNNKFIDIEPISGVHNECYKFNPTIRIIIKSPLFKEFYKTI